MNEEKVLDMKAGAIILSGGKSSRMGSNKALLKLNEKTNIERIRDELSQCVDDIILVTNEPESYRFLHIKTVPDHYQEMGPLAGIHAGLMAAVKEINIIVACDMPFISEKLAAILIEMLGEYDAVVPVINGRRHPLFAVYKKSAITEIEKGLKNDRLSLKHLLNQLNVLFITEKDLPEFTTESLNQIFFNMNHPDEYEDAKKQFNE
jgi:molybdenum cofactor guanylyltransferase